jgi:TonB family protein
MAGCLVGIQLSSASANVGPPDPTRVRVPPNYPMKAIQECVEGTIKAELNVGPNGRVTRVKILSAEPSGYFEGAAKEALMQWQYDPSLVASGKVSVEIKFELPPGKYRANCPTS